MHDNINVVNTDQKLLFDIRELLIEQNTLLKSLAIVKPLETVKEVKEVKEEITLPVKKSVAECPQCGGDHSNIGVRLACAKKFKNKGA